MNKSANAKESHTKWQKIKLYAVLGALSVMIIVVLGNSIANKYKKRTISENDVLLLMDRQLDSLLEEKYPGAQVLYKSEYELIEENRDAESKMRQAKAMMEMYNENDPEKAAQAEKIYDKAKKKAKEIKKDATRLYMRNIRIEYEGKKYATFQKTAEDLGPSELTTLLPIDGDVIKKMGKELEKDND